VKFHYFALCLLAEVENVTCSHFFRSENVDTICIDLYSRYLLLLQRGGDLSQFITENAIWLAPAISVILSILFKAGAKNSHVPLELSDFLDFGFGLLLLL